MSSKGEKKEAKTPAASAARLARSSNSSTSLTPGFDKKLSTQITKNGLKDDKGRVCFAENKNEFFSILAVVSSLGFDCFAKAEMRNFFNANARLLAPKHNEGKHLSEDEFQRVFKLYIIAFGFSAAIKFYGKHPDRMSVGASLLGFDGGFLSLFTSACLDSCGILGESDVITDTCLKNDLFLQMKDAYVDAKTEADGNKQIFNVSLSSKCSEWYPMFSRGLSFLERLSPAENGINACFATIKYLSECYDSVDQFFLTSEQQVRIEHRLIKLVEGLIKIPLPAYEDESKAVDLLQQWDSRLSEAHFLKNMIGYFKYSLGSEIKFIFDNKNLTSKDALRDSFIMLSSFSHEKKLYQGRGVRNDDSSSAEASFVGQMGVHIGNDRLYFSKNTGSYLDVVKNLDTHRRLAKKLGVSIYAYRLLKSKNVSNAPKSLASLSYLLIHRSPSKELLPLLECFKLKFSKLGGEQKKSFSMQLKNAKSHLNALQTAEQGWKRFFDKDSENIWSSIFADNFRSIQIWHGQVALGERTAAEFKTVLTDFYKQQYEAKLTVSQRLKLNKWVGGECKAGRLAQSTRNEVFKTSKAHLDKESARLTRGWRALKNMSNSFAASVFDFLIFNTGGIFSGQFGVSVYAARLLKSKNVSNVSKSLVCIDYLLTHQSPSRKLLPLLKHFESHYPELNAKQKESYIAQLEDAEFHLNALQTAEKRWQQFSSKDSVKAWSPRFADNFLSIQLWHGQVALGERTASEFEAVLTAFYQQQYEAKLTVPQRQRLNDWVEDECKAGRLSERTRGSVFEIKSAHLMKQAMQAQQAKQAEQTSLLSRGWRAFRKMSGFKRFLWAIPAFVGAIFVAPFAVISYFTKRDNPNNLRDVHAKDRALKNHYRKIVRESDKIRADTGKKVTPAMVSVSLLAVPAKISVDSYLDRFTLSSIIVKGWDRLKLIEQSLRPDFGIARHAWKNLISSPLVNLSPELSKRVLTLKSEYLASRWLHGGPRKNDYTSDFSPLYLLREIDLNDLNQVRLFFAASSSYFKAYAEKEGVLPQDSKDFDVQLGKALAFDAWRSRVSESDYQACRQQLDKMEQKYGATSWYASVVMPFKFVLENAWPKKDGKLDIKAIRDSSKNKISKHGGDAIVKSQHNRLAKEVKKMIVEQVYSETNIISFRKGVAEAKDFGAILLVVDQELSRQSLSFFREEYCDLRLYVRALAGVKTKFKGILTENWKPEFNEIQEIKSIGVNSDIKAVGLLSFIEITRGEGKNSAHFCKLLRQRRAALLLSVGKAAHFFDENHGGLIKNQKEALVYLLRFIQKVDLTGLQARVGVGFLIESFFDKWQLFPNTPFSNITGKEFGVEGRNGMFALFSGPMSPDLLPQLQRIFRGIDCSFLKDGSAVQLCVHKLIDWMELYKGKDPIVLNGPFLHQVDRFKIYLYLKPTVENFKAACDDFCLTSKDRFVDKKQTGNLDKNLWIAYKKCREVLRSDDGSPDEKQLAVLEQAVLSVYSSLKLASERALHYKVAGFGETLVVAPPGALVASSASKIGGGLGESKCSNSVSDSKDGMSASVSREGRSDSEGSSCSESGDGLAPSVSVSPPSFIHHPALFPSCRTGGLPAVSGADPSTDVLPGAVGVLAS